MQWVAISGSWRHPTPEVERDVRRDVAEILRRGDGIVSGGALGVDYIATEEALEHNPSATQIQLIIPTPLSVYAAHYERRAHEGVITHEQAQNLIAQLRRVQAARPGAVEEMNHTVCNETTYYARNARVIEYAQSLHAYRVNMTGGTTDAVNKAQQRGIPVILKDYTLLSDFATQARQARQALHQLAKTSPEARTKGLLAMASALRAAAADILAANAADLKAAPDLTPALRDRLLLTPARVEAMAVGVEAIAAQPDPVGCELARWSRPNGLIITRVAVPLGVIGIIYESRPNVTADAGALCLRAGNACLLRGGSESFNASRAIHQALQQGLRAAGLPVEAIQMATTTDRAVVGEMLAAHGLIDVLIPRGGKSLVARVQAESRVPILAHLEGNNHVYVHASADPAMAEAVVVNAKMRRTSVCGAAETLLIDKAYPHAAQLVQALLSSGCALRGDEAACALNPQVTPATEDDWRTEYLDAVMAVRVVAGLDEALAHIARYGSQHTEAIISADQAAAARFLAEVDAAIVLHNASTQFADGGEFGFGGEVGIATGRLHARGPVGAAQLTTSKYCLYGTGQVRE